MLWSLGDEMDGDTYFRICLYIPLCWLAMYSLIGGHVMIIVQIYVMWLLYSDECNVWTDILLSKD